MKNLILEKFIECIDELIETSLNEEYVTSAGERVKNGSRAHIKDLENSIKNLERYRDTEKRGSASRDTYARAIARLKNQLKKAIAASDKVKKSLKIS